MEFIDFLNKKTNNMYTFVKLTDVIYSKKNNCCTCKFVYDGEVKDLDENDKSLFSGLLKEYIGENCDIVIKFKKESLDKEVLFQHISTFIQLNFPSAFSSFKPKHLTITQNEESVELNIQIVDMYFEYLVNRNFDRELLTYLAKYYFKKFTCNLIEITGKTILQQALEEQESIVQEIVEATNYNSKVEYFFVDEVRKLIGEELDNQCRRYNSLKKPIKDVVTAGKIKGIFERTFKSKHQKEEDGNPKEKVLYNVKLAYGEENMDCVYFPKDADLANFQTLNIDDDIIIFGDVEQYNERTNFKIKGISLCKLQQIEKEKIVFKTVNDEYKHIFPEKYVIREQSNLFDFEVEKEVNSILKNNVFVAYDFETTGFNHIEDEIIEIGAVKIAEGKIVETFTTLIKPTKEITERITQVTGIDNAMVENAPSIADVLPDFYKFCYNTIMVGHNSIGFDNLFLQNISHKLKYNFDMKQMDTLNLSREYIKGIKNYKLGTVSEYLNIKLANAHRALNDTIATAQVFIKLTDYLQSIEN